MYTQCPECQIAFRVTAKVLQQAQGNVRCGSCGHAFNALHYLSEDMPGHTSTDGDDPARDELAETSRRLLQTLDDLAGPDEVRIEDTGVEWRVLDEQASPPSPEDERRYDDNSPLPDEYDDNLDYSPSIPQRRESDAQAPTQEFEDRQHDLALSEPEDWTDILQEVSVSDLESFAVEEELVAIHNELASVDDSAAPGEGDKEFASVDADVVEFEDTDAESDLSMADAIEFEDVDKDSDMRKAGPVEIEGDDAESKLATADPIDFENIDASAIEFEGVDAELAMPAADDAMTDEVPQLAESDFDTDEPIGDEESLIEEIEAVAMEIDEDLADTDQNTDGEPVSGEFESLVEEDTSDQHDIGNELTGEFEASLDEASVVYDDDTEHSDEDIEQALMDDDADADDATSGEDDDDVISSIEQALEAHDSVDDEAPVTVSAEEDDDDTISSIERALDMHVSVDDQEPVAAAAEEDIDEPVIPEPTEEELTINMEIDQQMMSAAREDDEFSRTLVGIENPEELFNENSAEVETIIMEGEFIRNEVEKERLAAENAARSQLDDPARLADTYALNREKLRGGRRSYDPPAMGMVAAIVALTLLLAGQYVHNARDSLATIGFFQQTVAPIYRVFGSPVTPAWDIRGWQFEATSGNVDEEETQLTIVSRIVNRSEESLPFPLVHVSLTNRFEDVMGSRVLEPADYLPDDHDPSELVSPGVNFNAVIVIEQPSPEATGFKLNVCYRVETGVVRCALEDFK